MCLARRTRMSRGESVYRLSPIWAQRAFLNAYGAHRWLYGFSGRYRVALGQIRERESWDQDRIRDFQSTRVRDLVAHAYANTGYYRQLMDRAGIRPQDIRGIHDLARLPVLTRETIRAHPSDLMTARKPRLGWTHGHTSGTTGSPLSLWYDRETCIQTNAQDRRQKIWGGMTQGDWIGMFLGRMVVPVDQRRPPYWRENAVNREVWFSSFHMGDESLGSYLEQIRKRRLRFLEGYPSTLFILAKGVLQSGQRLPMKAVFTSSETLHHLQRETIETAFGCRLFDFYGHAERTIFAAECESHDGRHVAEDFGYTEIVDDGGNPVPTGSWGYLTGTSLYNHAMPMIRYRTTDLSRFVDSPCACGRSSRRLDPVTTKAEDVVITPDGRVISPSILTHPFKPFSTITKSQIIQEATDRIVVKLVAGAGFDATQQEELTHALGERLGQGVRIEVALVDDIPPERSGKFRWVISKVDAGYSPKWTPETSN